MGSVDDTSLGLFLIDEGLEERLSGERERERQRVCTAPAKVISGMRSDLCGSLHVH